MSPRSRRSRAIGRTVLLIFGALIVGAASGLICAPFYASMLARHCITKWISKFALASRQVLIGSSAAVPIIAIAFGGHMLNIGCIWSIG
jgi:hypothetical protein